MNNIFLRRAVHGHLHQQWYFLLTLAGVLECWCWSAGGGVRVVDVDKMFTVSMKAKHSSKCRGSIQIN